MWLKKTIVKISVAHCEDLDRDFVEKVETEFPIYYTPFTRIETLLRLAHRNSRLPNPYEEEKTHFMVRRNGAPFWLDDNGRIAKLCKYLDCDGCIDLEYVLYNGIGATLDRTDGITIFYHTKELRHVPHIHASYQGEEISIDILTLKVKGKLKNKKKQNIAVEYVRKNKQALLEEYNNKTNGIRVFSSEIE